MSDDSRPDDTAPTGPHAGHGLDGGIALVLRAEDSGEWKPVADWLARNADHARDLAEFLAADRGIRSEVARRRVAPPERSGITVGGLELQKLIGEGGAGDVYLAHDSVLNRHVAVKLLRAGRALAPRDLARFRFEAEAVAGLDHPNIVRVHAFGEVDGVPYLVMPLMPGGSLAARLRSLGPDRCRPADEVAELVRDIALGVHHAHQRGLIHRDLKPGNILLDANCRPHVADFGLAHPADATVTTAGGTPAYMAPEQARGEKHLTTAVDIHALGAILFELLAGHSPFGTGNVASVVRRVAEEQAPGVDRSRPDVPADLAAICAMCLEKRPGDRYPSAQNLADDLGRFLRREPVRARPRGLLTDVVSAIGSRHEAASMAAWPAYAFGAANTAVSHIAVAALLFTGRPNVALGVIAYTLCAWAASAWWFGVRRRTVATSIERAGFTVHIGMMLSVVAALPLSLALDGPDPTLLYPVLNAVFGCGMFALGTIHRGKNYLVGIIYVSQNLLLPFLPAWSWPALWAFTSGGVQAWAAVTLRRIDRVARDGIRAAT